MKYLLSILLMVVTFCFVACTEDTTVNSPSSNTPVIASTQNAFAYTLVANSFSDNTEFDLDFTSDSLAYSIVITGYKAGSGSLEIKDLNGANIYQGTLQSNKVVAFTQTNSGVPKKYQLALNNFTGTLNFALAKSNSGN